jgi:hypothetical protein
MACGGTVRGVRLLSQAGCDRAWAEQFRGEDRVLGMPMRYGMGYGLFGSTYGWGGSMVMIEPDARMAVSYVTNQILGARRRLILDAFEPGQVSARLGSRSLAAGRGSRLGSSR